VSAFLPNVDNVRLAAGRDATVGVEIGIWHFGETQGDLPRDVLSAIAAMARRLEAATGLPVEQRNEGRTLRVPALREEWMNDPALRDEPFDCACTDRTITVLGFVPAHPYLWENLDAAMTAAGGRRNAVSFGGRPNPAHARLRRHWDTLSSRDRFLLAMPSLLGARLLNRPLSIR
jgi:hypothetical protein